MAKQDTVTMTVRVPTWLREALEAEAVRRRKEHGTNASVSRLLREAGERYYGEEGKR